MSDNEIQDGEAPHEPTTFFVGYAGIRTYCLEMYYGISVLQS